MNDMWSLVKWWNRNTNFRPPLAEPIDLIFPLFTLFDDFLRIQEDSSQKGTLRIEGLLAKKRFD